MGSEHILPNVETIDKGGYEATQAHGSIGYANRQTGSRSESAMPAKRCFNRPIKLRSGKMTFLHRRTSNNIYLSFSAIMC